MGLPSHTAGHPCCAVQQCRALALQVTHYCPSPCSWLRPLVVFFSRGVFFMGGFHWVTVKGKRALPSEAPVLATAPHSSYFDALPVTFLDLTTVVAKSSAANVPFFGSRCLCKLCVICHSLSAQKPSMSSFSASSPY